MSTTLTRSVLDSATSPDVNPTPGYLFDEMAAATQDPEVNARLVEYLVARLRRQSPDTKVKVLRIIRRVCYKGHHGFRRAWQQNVGLVKELITFKGPPDALRGDEPNKAVREAAKEAVEAIFDSVVEKPATHGVLAGRIKGFGNNVPPPSATGNEDGDDSYSGGHGRGAGGSSYDLSSRTAQSRYSANQEGRSSHSSSKKYEGIQNPNFRPPRSELKSFFDTVTEKVKGKVDQYAADAVAAVAAKTNSSSGVGSGRPAWMEEGPGVQGYSYANNRGSNGVTGTYDPDRIASSLKNSKDANWSANGYSSTRVRKGLSDSEPRSPKYTSGSDGITAIGASDGKFEQSLVDELCMSGGLKGVPPADDLAEFCTACKKFNSSVVMPMLIEKAQQSDWKVKHKALCVLEAILGTRGCESYGDYLDAHSDVLLEILSSSTEHTSVKERAKKVWALLYEDDPEEIAKPASKPTSEVKTTAKSTPNEEKEVNLLDFGSESESTPTPVAASNNAVGKEQPKNVPKESVQAKPTESNSMFGNLKVKAATPSAQEPNLLGDDFFESSKPAAAPPQKTDDLLASEFSFLSTSATLPPVTQQPAPPQVLQVPIVAKMPFQQPLNTPPQNSIPVSTGFSFMNTAAPIKNGLGQQQQQQQQPPPQLQSQPIRTTPVQPLSGLTLQESLISSNLDQLRTSNAPPVAAPKTSLGGQPISVPVPSAKAVAPAVAPKPVEDSFSFVAEQMMKR